MKKKVLTTCLVLIFISCNISFVYALSQINLSYDANGNLIQTDNYYYEYNNFNQLERVRESNSEGRVISEYFYDGEGQRVMKITYDEDGESEETHYISDNIVQIINSSGVYNEIYYYQFYFPASGEYTVCHGIRRYGQGVDRSGIHICPAV